MDHVHHYAVGSRQVNRRSVILGTAALMAGAAVMRPAVAQAKAGDDKDRPQPAPKPIPGTFPGTPFHVFAPGPTTVTLPFSGLPLMGLDVDPSVILDFNGFTALAYPVGSAIGSDGKRYNLEGDMRIYKGTYVPVAGAARQGTFGFV